MCTTASIIPRPRRQTVSNIPTAQKAFQTSDNTVVFSFEAYDKTEYFNLDGTCQNWAAELIDMMQDVSTHTVVELTSGRYNKYRVHDHRSVKKCPSPLPAGVALKDMYQIRISKSKGGIHGVFRENTFYVIWLDPLHNMYPDEKYGGLRKVRETSTCCKDRDEELLRLQEELEKARNEAKEWEQLAQEFAGEHDFAVHTSNSK